MDSDEVNQEEVRTEHVPQTQPRGRTRKKPLGDPNKMIEALQVQNDNLQKQLDSVMNMLLAKASDQPTNYAMPQKPATVHPPKGYHYELTREVPEQGIQRPDVFVVTVPQRPDNPNEPDPRYCAFCAEATLELTLKKKGVNLAELMGLDIPANPDEAGMKQVQQMIRMHMAEIAAYENSKKAKLKRLYADHFELRATKRGPVPDVVRFRTTGRKDQKDKEVSLSAAELNELNEKQWKAACQNIAINQGR
jgi:hypothetical protein